MKKEIKQEVFTNVHIEITHKTLHFTQKSAYPNSVVIEKSKAREVALAIDPTIEIDLKQLSIEQSQNEMLIQELHEKDKEIERLKEFEFMYNELKK